MADIWKTEYHLLGPDGRAEDWFDERDEAVAIAKANGEGWKVEAVTSYLDDRETAWPKDDDQ